MPFAVHATLAPVEAFQGREGDRPAVGGRVIDRNAALGHHLLKIAQAQIVGEVPAQSRIKTGGL